jgi:signal transduction histidine kinase
MPRLGTKLALFSLLSKLAFTAAFLIFLPKIVERINIIQTDNELIKKREQVIDIISRIGIEPFITGDTSTVFGSYNILKEEYVSLEKVTLEEDWNFISLSERVIDNETIEYRVLNYSFQIDGEMYLLEIGKSLVSIEYNRQNIRKVILIFLLTFILITISADLFYTGRVVYPLKLIRNKLKMTSTPALYDKIPVNTTTSDFLQLDQTINELMNKIDELFLKEKEITVNISHELITPVSVLRSKLENILLNNDLDHEMAAKIEDSLKTLHRLKSLINSLLLVARIESQQFLKEDTFSLSDLLKEIKDELDPIASDKGVIMSEDHCTDYIIVKANRPLIFSMIYNVVNNAIKNTENPGFVKIISTFNENRFKVTIRDSGSGINDEQMKTLFSRFKRKLDPDKENTGIGLAITKSIADFHKIDIMVLSEPGKGTDFLFIFPENS